MEERPRDSSVTDGPAVRRVAERCAQVVERQEWLNKPGYKLEHGMAFVFGLAGHVPAPCRICCTEFGSDIPCIR